MRFEQTVKVFLAVNAANKSKTLTNGNLINETQKPWTELKVSYKYKTVTYWICPLR